MRNPDHRQFQSGHPSLPSERLTRSRSKASGAKSLSACELWVVYPGARRYVMGERAETLPFDALSTIAGAGM